MRLKSFSTYGFKSFADKTELTLDKGITAVVGPNGSGKSNISDAIRWALGEQSAKYLRGSKMEDVIFSGSGKRRPLGVAEVNLEFDNSDHTLALDFDTVTITRRLYRSGDSDYAINKKNCRLKDIIDLLASAAELPASASARAARAWARARRNSAPSMMTSVSPFFTCWYSSKRISRM